MRKSTFIFSFLSVFFLVQHTIAADLGDSIRKVIQTKNGSEEEINLTSKKETFKAGYREKPQTKNTISLRNSIIIFAFMLLILATVSILYIQNRKKLYIQQQYSQRLLIAQEEEKDRISRELHNNIGQNILFIRNQMVKGQQTELLPAVDQTIREVRNISRDLYPTQLEKYGLTTAVDALIEGIQEHSEIFISHDLEVLDIDLSNNQKINYYRIIQECISNTLKYAEASALRISTETKPNGIELTIQDNGKGFDKSILTRKSSRSMGMLNIEERVKSLKGKFELETSPGNGTRYTFLIPS